MEDQKNENDILINQLNPVPETEFDYFAAIESLGGMIFYTNHDLAHGRIKANKEEVRKIDEELTRLQKIQTALVAKVCEKFNVISLQDENQEQEGKVKYWDWYREIKERFNESEFRKTLCAHCPFGTMGHCDAPIESRFLSFRQEPRCAHSGENRKEVESKIVELYSKIRLRVWLGREKTLLCNAAVESMTDKQKEDYNEAIKRYGEKYLKLFRRWVTGELTDEEKEIVGTIKQGVEKYGEEGYKRILEFCDRVEDRKTEVLKNESHADSMLRLGRLDD